MTVPPVSPKIPHHTPPAARVERQVGLGVQGSNGSVPNTRQPMDYRAERFAGLDYLEELTSGVSISPDDVDALIGSITFAGHEMAGRSAEAAIKANFGLQTAALSNQESALGKAAKQIQDYVAQQKQADGWGIFSFICKIVVCIAALVAGIFTGGATWVVFALMVLSVVNDAIKMADGGKGIGYLLAKAGGASDDTANNVETGFEIGVMVLAIAFSFGAAAAGAGAETAADVADKIAKFKDLITAAKVIGIGAQMVGSGAEMVKAGYTFESESTMAMIESFKGQGKQWKAYADQLSAALDKLFETLMHGDQDWVSNLKAIGEHYQEQREMYGRLHFS
jgi:hypothetical protein